MRRSGVAQTWLQFTQRHAICIWAFHRNVLMTTVSDRPHLLQRSLTRCSDSSVRDGRRSMTRGGSISTMRPRSYRVSVVLLTLLRGALRPAKLISPIHLIVATIRLRARIDTGTTRGVVGAVGRCSPAGAGVVSPHQGENGRRTAARSHRVRLV